MKKTARKRKWAAWALCAALACALFPASGQTAGAALYQPAFANHYGRSDVRAYLNSGLKTGLEKNYRANAVVSGESPMFEKHFTQGELTIVRPSTVQAYNTKTGLQEQMTDRFYLPAADEAKGTLFYSQEDAPSAQSEQIIPKAYYASARGGAWVRTAAAGSNEVLVVERTAGLASAQVFQQKGVAALCRVDVGAVSFAAMADASVLAAQGGAAMAQVDLSGVGEEGAAQSGVYGMYLKATDHTAFSVDSYRASEDTIALKGIVGARKGAYVVLCAYPSEGKAAYPVLMAAQQIQKDGQTEMTLNTAAFGEELSRLGSYTLKIWMETPAAQGEAFARATAPVQLGRKLQNKLVLAEKEQIGCSWEKDFAGQVLYFGRDQSGQPLEWWICAKEEEATGAALVLYQKRAVEQTVFNESVTEYAGTGVQFPEEILVTYGQTLSQGALMGGTGLGTFSVSPEENLASRPDVSDNGVMISVDFTPENAADYSWNSAGAQVLTRKVALRVEPAAAKDVSFPSGATVRYGSPLSSAVFLTPAGQGKYAFVNGSLMLEWEQDGASFDMAYYPGDTANYDYTGVSGWDEAKGAVVRRVSVHMIKGEGKVSIPLIDPVEYRPEGTLGDVALPAGWAWERPETVPTVNNDGYAALYTPSDTANYDYSILQGWDEQTGTVRRVVPLVVAKAEPKVELPAVEAQEYEKGTKLGEILLPEGWAWAEQDAALRLGEKTYTAVYTPADPQNYREVVQAVSVTVQIGEQARQKMLNALWIGSLGTGALAAGVALLLRIRSRSKKKKQEQ